MAKDLRLVLVTCKDRIEADLISESILKKRLVACCNSISSIKSRYWWKGKIEDAEEVLLLLKTRRQKLEQLIDEVKRIHSYEVPEIIALSIENGNRDYLKWIGEETREK